MLDGTITTPTPTALHRVNDAPHPVFQEVGDISDGVAVRQEVPTAGAIAVVVEPGAEDQVGSRCEEEATIVCQYRGYMRWIERAWNKGWKGRSICGSVT